MVKKTKKTQVKKAPSKAARGAAEALLSVPTALGLMAAEVQKMTQQMGQMELMLRELMTMVKLPPTRHEASPFALLTEPAPVPSAELMQEFKHEPKDLP